MSHEIFSKVQNFGKVLNPLEKGSSHASLSAKKMILRACRQRTLLCSNA